MVRVNLVTLTDLTKRFTADMAARGYGRVLNLGSTAAFIPGPNMAVYYATKAYVLSLSEALNYELRPKGVTVTALCPGPVETGFQQRANQRLGLMLRILRTDLDFVARTGYQAMRKGRPLVVPGWILWLITLTPGFTPRRLMTALSAHLVRAAR